MYRKLFRPLLMTGVVLLTFLEIVALSPASVEEDQETVTAVDPEIFVPTQDETLATGIPQGKIPDYSVDQFNYMSTQSGVKQWKLVAQRAYLYNQEKLVHSRIVQAHLYDSEGKVTLVTGKEAKYYMNNRDLEIFGDVKTTFPDGFQLESPYLLYRPAEGKVEIPEKYPVRGDGSKTADQKMLFTSYGFDFFMKESRIVLPRAVQVTTGGTELIPTGDSSSAASRTDMQQEKTVIDSDRCVIYRARQLAEFTMFPKRSPETRFVRITQPRLFTRSRRTDLNYGDNPGKLVNYLVATEDVLIKETGKNPSLKYATGGKASFDSRRDLIVLTEYPQVYQDHDTVTGDVILLHRDTDIVEVEHSNAYSQGQP